MTNFIQFVNDCDESKWPRGGNELRLRWSTEFSEWSNTARRLLEPFGREPRMRKIREQRGNAPSSVRQLTAGRVRYFRTRKITDRPAAGPSPRGAPSQRRSQWRPL